MRSMIVEIRYDVMFSESFGKSLPFEAIAVIGVSNLCFVTFPPVSRQKQDGP